MTNPVTGSPGPPDTGDDDFGRIQGLGLLIARHLHEAGIHTYGQLAALPLEELMRELGQFPLLAAERIIAQSWRAQAQLLAAEAAPAAPVAPAPYLSFTVELLIDAPAAGPPSASGEVRRTRLTHLQSGTTDSWAGWDEARLLRAMTRQIASWPADAPQPPSLPADEGAAAPLELELKGLTLDEQAPTASDRPRQDAGLSARLSFRLVGRSARGVADARSPYLAQLTAVNLEDGQSMVLAAARGCCGPGRLDYAQALPFATPDDGRYQLVGTVLLSEEQLVASVLGPVLRVIP